MRHRPLVITVASSALAVVLVIALIKVAHVDVRRLLGLLAAARPLATAVLVLLAAFHILLAAEKWRLVEQRVVPGSELPRRLCFSLTAIGAAVGQIVPMQVATALSRSLGAHLATGSGAVRGALATVFEQMFDIVVVCLLGLLSAGCLWRGDAGWWGAGAVATFAVGFMLVPRVFGMMAAITELLAKLPTVLGARIGNLSRALARYGLFEARLARRLFVLSALRFVMLWLMTIVATHAVGLNISSVQIAAALPFVVLAMALAVTPGGVGVNEWTFVAALVAFGVDLETATQCALVNRLLVGFAVLMVGAVGAILTQLPYSPAVAPGALRLMSASVVFDFNATLDAPSADNRQKRGN
ncbi:MAG TPA: lysylphosphatidylglycerol synthase transmembrane domain-containing protein [Xanthobacteraceae bacterium]